MPDKPHLTQFILHPFFNYKLAETLNNVCLNGSTTVVNCLNPHSFVKALDDEAFRTALEQSDVLLPDGEGICMALRLYGGKRIKKIAGDDLHRYLLQKLNKSNSDGEEHSAGKVYYMGSSPEVLKLIEKRLHQEYPNIEMRCWSPSFCDELSQDESRTIIDDINTFCPDVLFVSMTAPKQEKWVDRHRKELTKPQVIASIGAVFEFYAGTVKRAPQWAVSMKMEWLFRLIKEPRRMWERNFVSTPRYLKWVWRHRRELKNEN